MHSGGSLQCCRLVIEGTWLRVKFSIINGVIIDAILRQIMALAINRYQDVPYKHRMMLNNPLLAPG